MALSTPHFARQWQADVHDAGRCFAHYQLDAHGHRDWRPPSKGELDGLFNNRAAIGGVDVTGSFPAGWYWSASEYNSWVARAQRFSDGFQDYYGKDNRSSLRCVR